MKVRLRNRQPRVLGLVTGHKLLPSKKVQDFDMTPQQLNTLLSDKTFKSWQRLHWVAIVQSGTTPAPVPQTKKSTPPPEHELAGALDDVNVDDATDLINATEDEELLALWSERDAAREKPRVTIERAIAARLEALALPVEPDGDPPDGPESNEPDPDDDVDELFGDGTAGEE